MDDPPDYPDRPGDLRTPFIFVPHGDPEPTEWMAGHLGWMKFQALMVPRAEAASDWGEPFSSGGGEERQSGMMSAFSRRPIPPDLGRLDPFDPMSPAFDPVATLRRLGYPPGGELQVQWWLEPLLRGPLSKPPKEILPRSMERVPGQSGKDGAKDSPSWSGGSPRRLGESPAEYARRVMDGRWGKGRWEDDPERQKEFRKIKKFGSRAFRDPKIDPFLFTPGEEGGA